MAQYNAYIGTYSKGENGGIFRAQVDDEQGTLTLVDTLDVENPSHLTLSPNGAFLYAASETGSFRGQNGGGAAACAVDAQGKLSFLNIEGTQGQAPCYVEVSPDGGYLYVANYSEGTATVFALDQEGKVQKDPMIVRHQGHGPNARRQEKAHVHCTRVTPDGKYLAVCDLGIDRVVFYPLCKKCGLDQQNALVFQAPAGVGPRHIEFSKDGQFAYVVTELACTVLVCAYADGKLTLLDQISTLPEGFDGFNTAAAIHFSPDGRFLTASNRGDDSLMIYAADGAKLTPVQCVKVGGKTPREFIYTRSGKYVFVCNQDSADITVLKNDPETGKMELLPTKYALPRPVDLIWGK